MNQIYRSTLLYFCPGFNIKNDLAKQIWNNIDRAYVKKEYNNYLDEVEDMKRQDEEERRRFPNRGFGAPSGFVMPAGHLSFGGSNTGGFGAPVQHIGGFGAPAQRRTNRSSNKPIDNEWI